jgi:hypothetical protein
MKERPILFSGPMVRAILDGTKSQTRRIVKPQPTKDYVTLMPLSGELVGVTKHGGPVDNRGWLHCPYGKPGDRLWVRETWRPFYESDTGVCGIQYNARGHEEYYEKEEKEAWTKTLRGNDNWRPSIHMPRWASRITLEVVSVRVERLQHISEEDAKAEGIMWMPGEDIDGYSAGSGFGHWNTSKDAFWDLWVSINGCESWDANPWVWVVEFKRIEP